MDKMTAGNSMFIAIAKLWTKDSEYYPFQTCIVAKSKGQLKRIMAMRGVDPAKYNIYDAQKVE